MQRGYELRVFGPGPGSDPVHISRLHASLLPSSPITHLGSRFRERFYYKDLPELELIFGAVAYVNNEPAGFVSATLDSDGFMTLALRKRPLRVMQSFAVAVACDPRRIRPIWEALQIQSRRGSGGVSPGTPAAEILSLGVLPEFRGVLANGRHIADDLVHRVVETCEARNAREIRVIVDTGNARALRFYEKLGWRPSRSSVPGWSQPSTELIRTLSPVLSNPLTATADRRTDGQV
jgi:ribosomal protein S18 acetylase RimI-like enzyme